MLYRGGDNEEVGGKRLNGAIKDESKREDRLDAGAVGSRPIEVWDVLRCARTLIT